MIEWSEQHLMIRDVCRRFIDEHIKPNLEALEHGELLPYDILRTMMRTFGLDEIAKSRFDRMIGREKSGENGSAERRTAAEGDAGADRTLPGWGSRWPNPCPRISL